MNQIVWNAFFVAVRSDHTLSGFVDTAVGMHDGVLDEVDAGSGRIMELRDGGISQEDTGEAWRPGLFY